jgi:hypothetical protein
MEKGCLFYIVWAPGLSVRTGLGGYIGNSIYFAGSGNPRST